MNAFGELAELELPACPVGLFGLAVVDEDWAAGVELVPADPVAVPCAPAVCC